MKILDENALGNMPASGGRMATSRGSCPGKCQPMSLVNRQMSRPPALTNQIEKEVNELLIRHTTALLRYAATVARDRTIVQDAVQEAFMRYFIARVGGQRMENPRAWLFRVVRNYILDCNRRSKCSSVVDLKEAVLIADSRQDAEAEYRQSEILRRALSFLSPREQECMQLRVEGFGYGEIAQVLRIRSGTVGALLARGLKKIQGTGLFSRNQRCFDRSSRR
jgi:RNA polymerase sigma-70 factor (ECF subfamily)